MTTGNSRLKLDAVALKRQLQAKVMADIEGMTPEEELAYYARKADLFFQNRESATSKRGA